MSLTTSRHYPVLVLSEWGGTQDHLPKKGLSSSTTLEEVSRTSSQDGVTV